jgi:O-glycosyl hydrolase
VRQRRLAPGLRLRQHAHEPRPVGELHGAARPDPLANRFTPLFTSHGYTAAPNSPLSGWHKPVWETEWSTFQSWDPAWDDGSTASGFAWAQNIYTGLTAADLNAFLYWWGSTTPAENGDNEGLIEIDGNSVATSGRLWAFANYSRFVRPGAVRIGSSSADGNLEVTAFRNLDGSLAVVVLNTASTAQTARFSLRDARGSDATPSLTDASEDVASQPPIPVRGDAFTATLPPRSLVTYLIARGGRSRASRR